MKHKHFLITVISIVVFILSGQNIWAQVPQTMSYQGVLMKAKGTLVQNGQYTLTFKLYDVAEGGKVLWTETQTVRVEDGLFNAALGSMNSLDIPFDQPYWLAVTIGDGEEVSRRMQLTSSAYSLQAQTVADKAITSKKIADGQVVRSINSVTDNVKLTAGENVTITQEGDELVISANSRQGDELVTLAKARTKGPDQGAPESVVESLVVNGKFGVKDPTSGNFTLAVLNDSVGIGTTSPSAKLDVVGTTELNGLVTINNNTVSQALNVTGFVDISNEIRLGDFGAPNDPGYTWLGDVDTGMFRAANNELGFTTGGTEKVRISSTGNVGIGTTNPQTRLHVTGAAPANPEVIVEETTAGLAASINLINTARTWGLFADSSPDVFGIFDVTVGTTRLAIHSNGDVGIGMGTASPNEQLEITGNFRLPATTATTGIIRSDGDLLMHTFGADNFFAGVNAGNLTMSGDQNTGVGKDALLANTTGHRNTAIGRFALFTNDTGHSNTGLGRTTLANNLDGHSNTAAGRSALFSNTSGVENVGIGRNTLITSSTGSQNTAIGFSADVSVDGLTNAIAIGANAVVNASNKIRLGDANITVLECQVGLTVVSDETKKENFLATDGEETLEKLSQFKLGSWNFKGQDSARFRHYGPMAQEFFKAFGHDGMGTIGNSTTISTSDLDGVMMIAIQALEKRTAELQTKTNELANLQAEVDKMNQRMTQLEETLQRFAAAKPASKEETQASAVGVSEPR